MKLIKLAALLFMVFILGCEDNTGKNMEDESTTREVQDPSAANAQWVAAWNRNAPNELDTLTAKDAVLYMEGTPMNADSIRSWYQNAAPMMKDLRTNPQEEYSTNEIAYEAGTYQHGIQNDSLNTIYEGSYVFIWKRTNSHWKLQVMNITSKRDMQE